MISIADYAGREQSYVKHIFLQHYLEALVYKTASIFPHIVYVDGFAGPWQSANENFQDTSFGIALSALTRARTLWKDRRDVRMSAFLVERNDGAYRKLAKITPQYSNVSIRTYHADFLTVLPTILKDIPSEAFAFFLIDPKGWRIRLNDLAQMLERPNSEVIFNFMFDFINRAASIKDPAVVRALDELIPYGDWRVKLREAEQAFGGFASDDRKHIMVGAFKESLARLGKYTYVAETTVLRPLKDRALYCLFYATRHPRGIEVFRDCQIKALKEQSRTRAATKIKRVEESSGQGEIFQSLHDMGPDELTSFLEAERRRSETVLLELTPEPPASIQYKSLRAQVLARQVVKLADVNKVAARLRGDERLIFPDWEPGKRVPQPSYRTQRAKT
jgi:three-Cys-motif partner protein